MCLPIGFLILAVLCDRIIAIKASHNAAMQLWTLGKKYFEINPKFSSCRRTHMTFCCDRLYRQSFFDAAQQRLDDWWSRYRDDPEHISEPAADQDKIDAVDFVATVQAVRIRWTRRRGSVLITFYCADTRSQHVLNDLKEP